MGYLRALFKDWILCNTPYETASWLFSLVIAVRTLFTTAQFLCYEILCFGITMIYRSNLIMISWISSQGLALISCQSRSWGYEIWLFLCTPNTVNSSDWCSHSWADTRENKRWWSSRMHTEPGMVGEVCMLDGKRQPNMFRELKQVGLKVWLEGISKW